jgi:AcrR family transcriptional regulator
MTFTAMPEPSKRWHRRKDERPDEIIDAALDLFTRKGFASTRLEEVARKAGISKGTLYLYFASKEALFKSVVQATVVPEIERAEQYLQHRRDSAAELIRQLLYQWWETVSESRLRGLSKLIIAESGNFPDLARYYAENVIIRARMLLANVIQRGVEEGEFRSCDPVVTARLLMAPVVFISIWSQSLQPFEDPEFDIKVYLDHHLDIFLHGILNDSNGNT